MRNFEKWAASLVIVGDEAFLPDELDGVDLCRSEKPLKQCRRCGRWYIRKSYSEHVDQFHHDGPRTAYWREKSRRMRAMA